MQNIRGPTRQQDELDHTLSHPATWWATVDQTWSGTDLPCLAGLDHWVGIGEIFWTAGTKRLCLRLIGGCLSPVRHTVPFLRIALLFRAFVASSWWRGGFWGTFTLGTTALGWKTTWTKETWNVRTYLAAKLEARAKARQSCCRLLLSRL